MWNKMTKLLMCYLFVFGMWYVAHPLTAHACSCAATPSIEDQLDRKTAIFTGKVLSLTEPMKGEIWSSADPVKAQFEVKRVWKGEVGSQTAVYTALSSVSCGYEGFKVNEEYIVFAYGDPDQLETGICEGTKTLASAQKELKALGAGNEPSKITSPQKVMPEIPTVHQEEDNQLVIPLFILAVALTLVILLVILIRRRRQ